MANDDAWDNRSSILSFNHNYSSATLVANQMLLGGGSGISTTNTIGNISEGSMDGGGIAVATDADNLESWVYTGSAVVLAINGFFGFTLNISVIVLMCKDMQLWNPINIILFNLVCSDFSVSVLGNPFTMTAAIYHRWIFGPTLCVCYGFFMALLGITSISTLTVLSYERLCTVKFPFTTKQLNNRGAFVSVGLIWTYSLVVTTPPLFGWGEYVNEAANISCSVNWEVRSANATSYVLYMFFLGLVVPASVITYSYVSILVVMKSSAMRVGKRNRSEQRVTFMVGIMITAFMVAWTPYSVFSLIKQFGDPSFIGPAMAVLPSLFAKTSICYNPIIYVGMNSQFQQAFNRIRGRASSFDHPSYSQTTTNNTMTLLNVPTSAESSISETTTKRKRRNGTSALNISAVDSQPESPSIVVASTKAAGNRVEFELTTIVINADGIPNGYSSQSDEISC